MEPRYLLDTNIISETARIRPNHKVLEFLTALDSDFVFLSVLTLGELRKGASHRRKTDRVAGVQLDQWIDVIEEGFEGRILPIDVRIATAWGAMGVDNNRRVVDTLLAATALVHDLILATRNVRDMQGLDVRLLNPWE